MKKFYLLYLIALLNTLNAQQWQWAKPVNIGVSPELNVMEPDINGNFYVGVNSGTGACIVKFDGQSNELWRLCVPGQIIIKGISSTGTDVFITGTFQTTLSLLTSSVVSTGMEDVFMMRLSSTGTFGWLKRFGNTGSDEAGDMTNDGKGSVYLTGKFNGNVSFGSQQATDTCGSAMFVAKFDLAGNLQLLKQSTCIWSTSSYANGKQIIVDKHSNIYVLGTYSYFNLDSIELSGGGGPYEAWFVCRIDSNGTVNWVKQTPNQTILELYELALNANDDLLITGYHHWTSGGQTYTFKLNSSNGQIVWSEQVGGSCYGDQGVSQGIATEGNNSYLFGKIHLGSYCNFERRKLLLVQYDNGGQRVLFDTIALQPNAYSFDIIRTEPNAFVVSGVMDAGLITFGSHTVNVYNDSKLFIAKFYSNSSSTSLAKTTASDKILVYPNPSAGIFKVSLETNAYLKVYDLLGNCLFEKQCYEKDSETIDLKAFPKGIYLLQANSEDTKSWKKLVKD